jgi:predicted DNA-binding protein (MmcQ/YjbR family)
MSEEPEALVLLRSLCLSLPETSETDSWGHPNFRAGKRTFATFEWIKGRPSIAVHLGTEEADAFLLQSPESFSTPYGKGKWISVWADGELDRGYLQAIVERGYRAVALKRMLIALEDQGAHGADG